MAIWLPPKVEVLSASVPQYYQTFREFRFGSNSKLQRIEEYAFASSSLESLGLPMTLSFIDGSVFSSISSYSRWIACESPNFIVNESVLLNASQKVLIHSFSSEQHVHVDCDVEVLDKSSVDSSAAIRKITFDRNSKKRIICQFAFLNSSLQKIAIPKFLQILEEAVSKIPNDFCR
jgi:hypothetical protein